MTEDQLQAECFQWAKNNFCLPHHNPQCSIFSVPNGGTRNKIEAMKMKATGLTPGVSDLIFLSPKKCVFIELKKSSGIQSLEQKKFQSVVVNLGFEYYIIRSFEQFKKLIDEQFEHKD